MGARRYEISLRAFNSIAHEWPQRTREISSWTREEKIPYLQATVFYFVYNINTIALYLEEKPTSLMNENKWLDNPRITIVQCVGTNSSDGKMRWLLITKTTMVVNFNLQNSHWLTLSSPTEEVFEVNGKSSGCWFSFSAEFMW